MIDLYTTLGILVLHVSRGSKLIQGLLSASPPKRLLYFLVSCLAGYPSLLQPFMISTTGVVTL